jgi:hypothetical protein
MIKFIESINTDKVQLEVIECECGYHMGLDFTFLDQVGDFICECPSCGSEIDTSKIK